MEKKQLNTKKLSPKHQKVTRDQVWEKRNHTLLTGKCFVCQDDLKYKNFECGHVIPKSQGGSDEVDNLEPICSSCNKRMGSENMHKFKQKNFNSHRNLSNSSLQSYPCIQCGSMFLRDCELELLGFKHVNSSSDFVSKTCKTCQENETNKLRKII